MEYKKLRIMLYLALFCFGLSGCRAKTEEEETKRAKKQTVENEPETKEAKKTKNKKNTKEVGFSVISMDKDEYPRVDGSTATIPLSQALYRLGTGASEEEAIGAIVHSKTTESYLELMEGRKDLVIAYAPSKELQDAIDAAQKGKASFKDEFGAEIEAVPLKMEAIGRDALVFLTQKGNTIQGISSEQVVGIYSGQYTNWKEVGGEDLGIKAFQRNPNSGSQNLMEKLVMKGTPMANIQKEMMAGEMGELIEKVASFDNTAGSIGYSVYYYIHDMKQGEGLKLLEIDGIEPNAESIRSSEYPYINEFYVAIRADEPEDSAAHQLYDYLLSSDGQTLINYLGYVGVEDGESEKYPQIEELMGK